LSDIQVHRANGVKNQCANSITSGALIQPEDEAETPRTDSVLSEWVSVGPLDKLLDDYGRAREGDVWRNSIAEEPAGVEEGSAIFFQSNGTWVLFQ